MASGADGSGEGRGLIRWTDGRCHVLPLSPNRRVRSEPLPALPHAPAGHTATAQAATAGRGAGILVVVRIGIARGQERHAEQHENQHPKGGRTGRTMPGVCPSDYAARHLVQVVQMAGEPRLADGRFATGAATGEPVSTRARLTA